MSRRAALQLTPAQVLDLQARVQGRPSLAQLRDQPAAKTTARSKFGNTKVQDGAERFDSKAEHRRWHQLQLLQRAGQIRELRRQVAYELIPAQVRPSGGKERPTVYVADFVYRARDGAVVVEDVKGAVTAEYRLKRKLMLWRHGVEVVEVRA